jgi:digeranylgeranylglycerophospholipid reductase
MTARRVSIIGGSVSGLGTALEILRKDNSLDVTVYEKKTTCSDYTCAGGVSSVLLKQAKTEIPDYTVASKITSLRIFSPNGKYWETKTRGLPYGLVLQRNLFQTYLAKEIRRLGGKIRINHKIAKFDKADVIVGADGLMGASRQLLQLKPPSLEDIHMGVQIIARLTHPKECISLYFGNIAPHGYSWIFPHETPGYFRVGLGIPLSLRLNAKSLLTKFLSTLEAESVTGIKAKLIPTARPEPRLVYGNVLLVGDAALLCDPATGGGIVQGLLSAKSAARAICEGNIRKYPKYCSGVISTNLFRYKLKQVLCELSDEDFNVLIKTLETFHPDLTSVGRAIIRGLTEIAIKNPGFLVKHKVLRRLLL